MKVLIFGATGFLGQEICNLFKLQNIDFATVSRTEKADFKIVVFILYFFLFLEINVKVNEISSSITVEIFWSKCRSSA